MQDPGDFEEPDPDSDYDYEDSYSKRKKKKQASKSNRGVCIFLTKLLNFNFTVFNLKYFLISARNLPCWKEENNL